MTNSTDEIIVELLADEKTMEEIRTEFEISRAYLYAINSGRKCRMEGFKYPVRELEGLLDPNSAKQKQKVRAIRDNMEPEETYTLHLPNE